VPIECFAQRPIRGRGDARTCHHHQVQTRQLVLGVPKTLAHEALDPVPGHRPTELFLRDGETESRTPCVVGPGQDDEVTVGGLGGGAEDATELGRGQEPAGTRKGPRTGRPVARVQAGVRRCRPLARRAFRTLRPPLVAIRARKPWVRARLIRLGWNVRFMGR
jgi:hypothetical protein